MIAQLWTPEGNLRQEVSSPNLITTVGEAAYAAGYASMTGSSLTPPDPVYGMQLGTSNTAAAATGTGAAIVAYISGSNQPITTGWPQTAAAGIASTVRWKTVWEAGEATNSTIREVAMVTSSLDSAALAAETIARAVLTTTLDKWATDTLTIIWIHSFVAT